MPPKQPQNGSDCTGQVIGECTAAPIPEGLRETSARSQKLYDQAVDVGIRAARTNRAIDTVIHLGKAAYPGLRPHLLAAITDDDTIIDDVVVAFLDQVLGYDMVHAGVGISDQP